jgi:endonuclease-3 related protein
LTATDLRERLLTLYDALHVHFGHEPHWWPICSDVPQFEIIVGAVLVQQTRWETAESAVARLNDARLLSPGALAAVGGAELADLIRPCAFYAQKAPDLQAIARHVLRRHSGDVGAMLRQERQTLRAELLALPRVGRETADTIMLYAGGHPLFIVDAYARRLFARIGLAPDIDFERAPYEAVQSLVEDALDDGRRTADDGSDRRLLESVNLADEAHPSSVFRPTAPSAATFYWRFHALIDEACIHHCLARNPRCSRPGARRAYADPRKCAEHCLSCVGCPLRNVCAAYQRAAALVAEL